jgi:hypothetical protein
VTLKNGTDSNYGVTGVLRKMVKFSASIVKLKFKEVSPFSNINLANYFYCSYYLKKAA